MSQDEHPRHQSLDVSRENYRAARFDELRRIAAEQEEMMELTEALEKKVDNLQFKTNLMWVILGALAGGILTAAITIIVTIIVRHV